MTILRLAAAIAAYLAGPALMAQTGAAKLEFLEFDVAAIKPANPQATGSRIRALPGGGVFFQNVTLVQMIGLAYDLREFQIAGGPDWVSKQRFDVNAKAEEPESGATGVRPQAAIAALERQKARVKHLLSTRFQLDLKTEMREQSVYALSEVKTGHRMVETALTDLTRSGLNVRTNAGRFTMTARSMPASRFVFSFAGVLGRPVVDRTGLNGVYDFTLEWTDAAVTAGGEAPEGPSIFTAIQEQLGLRLESTRAPAEIYVIGRASLPSEN